MKPQDIQIGDCRSNKMKHCDNRRSQKMYNIEKQMFEKKKTHLRNYNRLHALARIGLLRMHF